jgi:hypothetical protein
LWIDAHHILAYATDEAKEANMLKIGDADNFRRTVAGLCLIAAPLAGLIGGLIFPPLPNDTAGTLAGISEHSGRFLMANFLFLVAFALMVPAVLGIMHLLRNRAVALGHIGGALVLLGNFFHAAVIGFALVQLPIAESGGDRAQIVALTEGTYASTAFLLLLAMLLIPSVLGSLILAVAVWRARVAPLWVAVVIVVGVATDFIVPESLNLQPDLYFAFTLLGFGWIGLKVLRMSDAQWKQASTGTLEADAPANRSASVR